MRNLGSTLKDIAKEENDEGLDVAFQDLTLTVSVGKREKVVVNKVSGRLRSDTMTGKIFLLACFSPYLLHYPT